MRDCLSWRKGAILAALVGVCLLAAPVLCREEGEPGEGAPQEAGTPAPPSSKPSAAKPTMRKAAGGFHYTWEKGLSALEKLDIRVGGVDLVDQSRHLVKTIPSMAAFLTLNHVLKFIMKTKLKLHTFPHTLTGMLLLFGGLCFTETKNAAKVVDFMEPATTLLTNFLPSFFIPALIVAPLAARDIPGIDIAKFLAIISIALTGGAGFTGHLVQGLQRLDGQKPAKQGGAKASPSNAAFKSWFSPEIEKLFAAVTALSGAAALAVPQAKPTFFVATTFLSFIFASRIPRVFSPMIRQYWHPLMTTYSAATITFILFAQLSGMGFFELLQEYMVGGGSMFAAAGNFIMFWLEPSIISFAFGLYARRTLLQANFMPIMAGTFISTVLGIFTLAGLNRAFDPAHEIKLCLLPKATAALAVVQAAVLGASTSLTTVNCCITGIMGANFGTKFNDLFHIVDPIARGLATGCSGLALASAALVQADPAAFPFGALGMALTSTWATILYSFPPFAKLIKDTMGQPPVPKHLPTRADSGRFTAVLNRISKFGGA
uniref:LrgB-like protein n=1 Tax=Hemiselmis andersenii TaxID=464988 RepID=A0A6U4VXY5_HEMAN|mmetsp:Transcript_39057/g.91215  ORF Transcript_39057/g.91215 Transcript_39057/m.91215 type:complete len:545 (+) Transcript_39057:53-1687(+)|eukprot:CAMPEP_0169442164 /NCGR_PEP_ID=MMETSP1042-20121227/8681_1 /TAXON_ID=464988 /ORGANISM="Hemiselmis andersenii, Strain CCMP1180" /LENGTH=544 /DNA_ID=CAMNT_0009553317 /DNA_START=53 /DNA_END=1687 /DNA_ORIENTATION=-